MSYCLNLACSNPENASQTDICSTCGSPLLLQERYRAIKLIGTGGFGRTFLAMDKSQPFNSSCVIKQFLPQFPNSEHLETALTLFRSEGMRLSELGKHPQLPQLFAFFEQEQSWYLVQEWIEGRNLATILQEEGAFSAVKVRQLLQDILPVLVFIHDCQLIHRDIKPQNIIYRSSDSRPVLVDFGAAKVFSRNDLARTGTVIGTAEYTAPEQARGKAIVASDLYGLGVTCIHLLTGISPLDLFDHGQDAWVWRDYLKTPLQDVALGQILDKMIHRATLQRCSNAVEVLQDLERSSFSLGRKLGKQGILAVAAVCSLSLGVVWIRSLQQPSLEWTTNAPLSSPFAPKPPLSTERLISTKGCVHCDLSNVNLSGIDLSGVNLAEANLNGANLSNTVLTHANFGGAMLREVNLSNSNLSNANLSRSDLTSANLSSSVLSGANLESAILQDTNFKNTDMTGITPSDFVQNESRWHSPPPD
jgi:Ca-activated chloride channel homolog